jgi:hypothetical protein
MEAPEQPHQHPAHTGHRWLDIALALSAMFVSVVSLVVAIEHGRTMERMADANTQMVEANSWPFIEFHTHNVDEQGKAEVRLVINNQGIGPARIQSFELWYDGQTISTPLQLLQTCCATTAAEREQLKNTPTSVGLTSPSILRAGDRTDFLTMSYDQGDKNLWDKFNANRDKITARICYCSVFDKCWISSGRTTDASRVDSCPVPQVSYRP